MSSPSVSEATASNATDPSLMLAPPESEGPDFGTLAKGFNDCIANLQGWLNQATENYNTRYALWPGQSADGRKHAREGSKIDPTPWENASDLQVYLCDEAINAKVAMQGLAFLNAQISATPTEGNDIKRAKDVAAFMRWLVSTQIPEVDREVELLGNYVNEMGLGCIGTFWEEKQDKVLTTVTLEMLQQQFPTINIPALLESGQSDDDLIAIFEEQYGCTRAKAKKILTGLRNDGTASVPTLGKKKSYPVIRAFDLNHNLFIPNYATDIENASSIYRVEYYTAEQLRSFVHTSGWDEGWVESAIERCKGKLITLTQNEYNQPVSRSFMYQEQRFTDLIGVCYAYQKLSDSDGYSGIYLTVFNPQLPPDDMQDGYAKFGLLGYADGEYPFTLFRREYLSRKLHDTRGIPEPGRPLQQQIKVHKDSLIDNASMQIMPPLLYPQGRPPLKWGAGVRHPERRPGEIHYASVPPYSPSNKESEQQLMADFNRYNGFATQDGDQMVSASKGQWEARKYLNKWADVFKKIWSRYRQFGNETVYFRVVGVKQVDPIEFHKGQEGEEFDFRLTFDIGSLDEQKQEAKLKALAQVCATFDKWGQVDYSQVLQLAIQTIDPSWAEAIIEPKETGSQKVVTETQGSMAQIYAGVDKDIDLNAPPQLVMQTVQNYAQAPDVQQRYQQDPAFKARLDKFVKQTQMQLMQQQNAKIGRYGA